MTIAGGMTAVTRITHLYSGDDGHSHFGDISLGMALFEDQLLRSLRSRPLPVQQLVFRESLLGSGLALRCSLKRQLIVTLAGEAEIEVHDGSRRAFGAGDILLAEDLSGSGHRTHELAGPRRCLVLPLAPDFELQEWLAQTWERTRRNHDS